MTNSDAHHCFQRGLALFSRNRFGEAAAQFETAVNLERDQGAVRQQMRYLSFLGVSRALGHGKASGDDLRLCQQAATADSFDPILQLNLAKVFWLSGKITRCMTTVEKGLRMDPKHRGLKAFLTQIDRRARPVIPRLGRDHAINRSIGRLRAMTSRQKAG